MIETVKDICILYLKWFWKTMALLIFMSFWPVGDTHAQIGDKLGKKFLNNVVQLTVKFSNGDETNGFGFVVGEREGQLYVVTANHVLHLNNPDVKTAEVQVRFFQDQAGKPVTGEALDVSSTQIFATGKDQQKQFYRTFDLYFKPR